MRTYRAFSGDVEFQFGKTETLGQYRGWRKRQVQAKDTAAIGTTKMHVLRMFDIGFCRTEAENTARIGCLMCQANIGEPIENTVEGYPIHSGERVFAELLLDIAVAQRPFGQLE